MKLFINARFLTQPISGVQRYGIECSLQIKKLYPESVFLAPHNILHKGIAAELGAQVVGSRVGHMWEQADLMLYMNRQGGTPLINLANTAPLFYRNNFITIHDLAFFHHPEWNSKVFSTWYNVLVPRLARRSKYIFTVSETVKSEIVGHYHIPPGKVGITYNGISRELAALAGGLGKGKEKIILSVGTFSLRKNQQSLVKAFLQSSVKETHRLVLIGDKNKVFAASGLDEAELVKNNIAVLQHVSGDALAAMYSKAEVVVSLSEYEGFGIPVLEGLFFGCKALCSDIPVYRELYSGVAGFCSPRDVASISATLENLVGSGQPVDKEAVGLLLAKYNYAQSARTIVEKVSSLYPFMKP